MNWEQLLADKRFRDGEPLKSFDGRNHFENDYSRLITSSFIRRLQDKTQVFPLQQSDFIRTRLTHSLEVSSIGRSIGKSVELELINSKKLDPKSRELLPCLLMTAGIIHDLGNPPYGHFGETAIKNYFDRFLSMNKTTLSEQEKDDFLHFDGNVQTFRILTKLQYMGDDLSYNLSFPTLAVTIKYPRNSIDGNKKTSNDIHDKKFGFFITEQPQYERINKELNLANKRHPATFLLEAADDIAYSAADIEDGIKLGILDFDTIYQVFEKNLSGEQKQNVLNKLSNYKNTFKDLPLDKLSLIVTRFRIFTQAIMIGEVIKVFVAEHDNILNGSYKKELLLESGAAGIRKSFKELSKIVFNDNRVLQAELAGYEIIQGLLQRFVEASYSNEFHLDGKGLEGKYYNMISSSLRYIYNTYASHPNSEYLKLQLIIDFISGMTDSYALNYFRKIKGIEH